MCPIRLTLCVLGLLCSVLAQDLPVCLDSFDIHQDKIIRTQDSRAMGAKYLNERDVSSRDECLRLCCETQDCDVFVFEEKTPGSCYLFQCGTPEDFKCKFTKHHNYTSAVLVMNRHLTELESQIKHTQHEHELAKLRKPDSNSVNSAITEVPTTAASGSKQMSAVMVPTNPTTGQHHRCSRFQFECHGSGECIAIYNACDGIPQCADGSDEAPELGCPAAQAASTVLPLPRLSLESSGLSLQPAHQQQPAAHPPHHQEAPPSLAEDTGAMPTLSKEHKSNQWATQMYDNQHMNMNNPANNYPAASGQLTQQQAQQVVDYRQPSPQLVSQVKQFGREGEGLLYRPSSDLTQWPPNYQQEPATNYHSANSGGSQIFSHKGSGLVSQGDRYRHAHGNKVVGEGGISQQFEPIQTDYSRYNFYENLPYHKQPQGPNNWQAMHKPHEMNGLAGMEEGMNMNILNMAQQNMPGQDYYYEENFRTRLQPQMIPQRLNPQANLLPQQEPVKHKPVHKGEAEVEMQEVLAESESKVASSNTSVKKSSAHHLPPANATEKPKEVRHHSEHHHSSHRKVDSLSAELSENSFDSEDGGNVNPRGAILSLTMGLCVTGIMLVLVGCRMRMVRRRMRRGSKSPYAHDADFLVNGMYL